MIRLISAFGRGAVVTIAFTQLASAADLSTKAPVYQAPVAVVANWTGLYVGGSVGGRWADTNWTTTAIGDPPGAADATTTPASFNSSAFRIGGYIG